MRKVALAATLLSLALVGSAGCSGAACNPVSGAATGAPGAAKGAAAAGPVGAARGGSATGLAAGPVAGTVGAVGTVGRACGRALATLVGSNYCPAGYTPVTPANTLPPNITGVGYCQALVAPVVAYTQPVTTRVAYVVPRRAVARVAYAYPRRAVARRVAYRTRAYGYRRVGFRAGPAVRAYGYRRVGFRTGPALGYRRAGYRF